MAEREEGCPNCAEAHSEVVKLAVEDPERPGSGKAIRAFYNCGICVMEFKKLRAEGSPTVAGVSPAEYAQLEVGSTLYGFQVWCRRHEVNVIHADFEGRKVTANMHVQPSPEADEALIRLGASPGVPRIRPAPRTPPRR